MSSYFAEFQSELYGQLAQAGSKASQFTTSLLEWGILGLLAYFAVIIIIVIKMEQIYRKEQDPFLESHRFWDCNFRYGFLALEI